MNKYKDNEVKVNRFVVAVWDNKSVPVYINIMHHHTIIKL